MRVLVGGALIALLSSVTVPAFAVAPDTAQSSITVLRPLTVTKNTDLLFGTIVEPSSGSGSIAISKTDGSITPSGGVASLASSTHGKANFTVAGEGGQAVTVSVPATFTLNGPSAATLTVTTDATNTGSQTLSGSLGGAGSLTVDVGGSIPISSSTTTGTYTGSFSVTANYQ